MDRNEESHEKNRISVSLRSMPINNRLIDDCSSRSAIVGSTIDLNRSQTQINALKVQRNSSNINNSS
jgi:uncharacterized protein YlaI